MASSPLDFVDRRAFDGARPAAPESPAELLRLAGLTDLDGVDLNELEGRLRRLTRAGVRLGSCRGAAGAA